MLFSLSALIVFYKGKRGDGKILLNDDKYFLEFWKEKWSTVDDRQSSVRDIVVEFLNMEDHFGTNLNNIEGFTDMVVDYVNLIQLEGMSNAIQKVL